MAVFTGLSSLTGLIIFLIRFLPTSYPLRDYAVQFVIHPADHIAFFKGRSWQTRPLRSLPFSCLARLMLLLPQAPHFLKKNVASCASDCLWIETTQSFSIGRACGPLSPSNARLTSRIFSNPLMFELIKKQSEIFFATDPDSTFNVK